MSGSARSSERENTDMNNNTTQGKMNKNASDSDAGSKMELESINESEEMDNSSTANSKNAKQNAKRKK